MQKEKRIIDKSFTMEKCKILLERESGYLTCEKQAINNNDNNNICIFSQVHFFNNTTTVMNAEPAS